MTDAPTPAPIPRAPSGLAKRGRAFWRVVVRDFELRHDELVSLEQACRLIDELDQMANAMRDAPLTIEGARGAILPHPLIRESRAHRATLNRILASLGLPEPTDARSKAMERSDAGRRMARARWDRRWGARDA